jgi:Ca2+-binding EF-hand superfamily protein
MLGIILLAGWCALAAVPGEGAAPPRGIAARAEVPGSDVQDVVYFGDPRPILLRLHVRIDGKPYQVVWEEFIDKLFRYLDSKNRGYLTREDVERIPPVQTLFNVTFFSQGGPRITMAALNTNKDGKVSREELADFYRRNGAAPFQFGSGGVSPRGVQVFTASTGMGQPSVDEINERLFGLLDTRKNGKLSRKELEAGPAILAKLDADDDEMISVAEIVPRSGDTDGYAVAFAPALSPSMTGNGVFNLVTSKRPDPAVARQLIQRYGDKKTGSKKLTRKAIGLDEEAFKALDADGDGELDLEELARFVHRAPDLELTIHLNNKPAGKTGVEKVKVPARSSLSPRLRTEKNGLVSLDLGIVRIDFGTSKEQDMGFRFPVRQQYLAQFSMADRDNNGYLDEKEAMQSPFFRNTFKLMDRDGDGKLYKKEVLAFLDAMEKLQKQAMASIVSLKVSDQGRGLFDLLDTDRDGRLSVRELRQLPKLLDRLDRDRKGYLSRTDIPRNYRVDLVQGPSYTDGFGNRFVVRLARVTQPKRAVKPTKGPLWFRKMDRNRDGDVSRREFLGTDEEFRRIDTDGDGLISVEEAEAYDKLMRKKGAAKK